MQEDDLPAIGCIENQQAFPWSKTKLEDCLRASYKNFVLEENHQILGYAILSVVMDEAEILNIAISSAQRRRGFGRLLLQHLLEVAKQQGVKKIFLEVRVANQAAIKLYESVGFKQVGVRENYYPSAKGREDALIFTKIFDTGIT